MRSERAGLCKTAVAVECCLWPLLALAVMAVINNITVLLQWRPHHIGVEYHGWLRWLDWSAVDYSAAATIVPLAALGQIICGLRLVRQPHTG